MFHIYLIMKVGNFIYYNIKELVAIRLIFEGGRSWVRVPIGSNHVLYTYFAIFHILLEIYDLGFYIYKIQIRNCHQECANSFSFELKLIEWQNMCTEHGLTRSGLEPTIYRPRGEHANDYSTDESLWWAFLVCFSANTYIVQGRIQDFKTGGAHIKKFGGISCEKSRFSTLPHYPNSEATRLCSFSLILRALHYKQQIPVDNLWFEIWICLYTCTQKVALYVAKSGCFGIRIMWQSGATCISADCCFR
jgi:hypothetical protein